LEAVTSDFVVLHFTTLHHHRQPFVISLIFLHHTTWSWDSQRSHVSGRQLRVPYFAFRRIHTSPPDRPPYERRVRPPRGSRDFIVDTQRGCDGSSPALAAQTSIIRRSKSVFSDLCPPRNSWFTTGHAQRPLWLPSGRTTWDTTRFVLSKITLRIRTASTQRTTLLRRLGTSQHSMLPCPVAGDI
jgi:hypothetical protein